MSALDPDVTIAAPRLNSHGNRIFDVTVRNAWNTEAAARSALSALKYELTQETYRDEGLNPTPWPKLIWDVLIGFFRPTRLIIAWSTTAHTNDPIYTCAIVERRGYGDPS